MADCYGKSKDPELTVGFSGLDGQRSSTGAHPAPASCFGFYKPTFIWLAFLSCIGIAGFIMAAWATAVANDAWTKVDEIYNTGRLGASALLVSNPKAALDAGYQISGHLYTGYWSLDDMDMLFQRSDHGAIAINADEILLFGGLTNDSLGNATVLSSVVKYNMYTGAYAPMAAMPEPRYRFGYALLANKLYIFAGFSIFDCGPTRPDCPSPTQLTSTVVYDITTDTWESLPAASNLKVPRVDTTGAAANGKVYCFGGYDDTWTPTARSEVFDPATRTWSEIPPMTVARGDLRAITVGTKIFVLGGTSTDPKLFPGIDCMTAPMGMCAKFYDTNEVFDTVSGKWSTAAHMIRPRGDFAVEVLNNERLLVAGGENGNLVRTGLAIPWVEEYVIADDVWVPKAALPQARFRFDMANTRNITYAFGGAPTCNTDQSNDCVNKGLATIFNYLENPNMPNLYAVYRPRN